MKKVKINQCCKCNHIWKQRTKRKPKQCPSCKNPNWQYPSHKQLINFIVGKT